MQMSMIGRGLAVLLTCVSALGCKPDSKDAAAGPARIDTTNAQWEDGLSAEQVSDSARALSPEEAAQMGIVVDTSIHLEQLDARDSLGTEPTARESGAADSVPVNPPTPR
jgi:hypothetical protein